MTPIEYLDRLAHYLRIRAAGYRHSDPPSDLIHVATAIEQSAEHFRRNDPSLPPRKKYPDPESYYAK